MSFRRRSSYSEAGIPGVSSVLRMRCGWVAERAWPYWGGLGGCSGEGVEYGREEDTCGKDGLRGSCADRLEHLGQQVCLRAALREVGGIEPDRQSVRAADSDDATVVSASVGMCRAIGHDKVMRLLLVREYATA